MRVLAVLFLALVISLLAGCLSAPYSPAPSRDATQDAAIGALTQQVAQIQKQLPSYATKAEIQQSSNPDLADFRQRLNALEGKVAVLKSQQDVLQRGGTVSEKWQQGTDQVLNSQVMAINDLRAAVTSLLASVAALRTELSSIESKLGVVP